MPPVVAGIAAAATSIGSAVAAAGIATSLTYVGTALTVAGAVTGSQKLMKWGSIVGLAGFGAGVGLFGEAAKTATWGSALGSGANTAANTAANAAVEGGAQSFGADLGPALTRTPLPEAGALTKVPDLATGHLAPGAGVRAIGQGGLQQTGLVAEASGLAQPAAKAAAAPTLMSKVGDAAGAIMDYAKTNPAMAQVLASGVGSVADYLSGATDAQLASMAADTSLKNANADKVRADAANEIRRRQNLNQGYMKVSTNPKIMPKTAGLIADAQTA